MQFGHALQRILQHMYDADPRHGPIYMMKVDTANGFIAWVWPQKTYLLQGYASPPGPDGKTLVVFHLVLLMGWV